MIKERKKVLLLLLMILDQKKYLFSASFARLEFIISLTLSL